METTGAAHSLDDIKPSFKDLREAAAPYAMPTNNESAVASEGRTESDLNKELVGPLERPDCSEMSIVSIQVLERSTSIEDDLSKDSSSGREEGKELPATEKRTGSLITCVIIWKAFMGSIFIFLPYAIKEGGLLLSLLTLLGLMGLSVYCMNLLIECCIPTGKGTYEGIAQASFGRWGKHLIELWVFASQVAFCSVYGIVASRNIRDVLLVASSCSPAFRIPIRTLIWCNAVYFMPISFVRNVAQLVPLILVGNAGTLLGMALLMGGVVSHIVQRQQVESIELSNLSGWPITLGTCVYVWLGAGLILPIRSTANAKARESFSRLLWASLSGLALLYVVYTSACVLAFGKDTEAMIIANLPSGPLGTTVQGLFAVVVLATYPLMLHPATLIAEPWAFSVFSVASPVGSRCVRALTRICLVLLTLCLATIGMQQLGNFVALVGAICGVPLGFVFPVILYLKLKEDEHLLLRCVHYVIIVIGCAISVFSFYTTIATWKAAEFISPC